MLGEILRFVKKYNLCPKTPSEKWLEVICYMQDKGWLHLIFENEKMVGMWGGYRIERYTKHTEDALPIKESGNILYIPFACSESKDRLVFLKEARKLVGIKEIVFNEHNKNGRLHKIKIRG